MSDPRFAKYLESTISFKDMIAFICEDPADNAKFLGLVRDEQDLRVNTLDMLREHSTTFNPSRQIDYYQ